MSDPFTMELRLCGDDGVVDGEYLETLNRLRWLGGHSPYEGAPFACTGSAHLAGEHVRCVSPAHLPRRPVEQVVGQPLNGWQVLTTGNREMGK